MNSYRVVLAISVCKFCRGYVVQFGGSGAAGGKDSGFCITITHKSHIASRAAIPRWGKTSLSSPNPRILRTLLRVSFGCSLIRKLMGLKGTHYATMEDIKSKTTGELRNISKEASRRCFQQWQDRWSERVYEQGSYFECD
jgi:hypothetical protein